MRAIRIDSRASSVGRKKDATPTFFNFKYDILGFASVSIATILYRVFLELIYQGYIAGKWSYYNFQNNTSPELFTVSWVALVVTLPLLFDLVTNQRKSAPLIIVLYLAAFVPSLVMLEKQDAPPAFVALLFIYWAVLFFAYYVLPSFSFPKPKTRTRRNATAIITIIFVGVVLIAWAVYARFRIMTEFVFVYDVRSESLTYSIPAILDYPLEMSRLVIPCLACYFLSKKSYKAFVVLLIVQYLNFCIDGLKTSLYTIVIAVVCYLAYGKDFRRKIVYLFAGTAAAAYFIAVVLNDVTIIEVVIRRILLMPAMLNQQYFEFFAQNPPDYFAQSFMRYFGMESPYDRSITFLIGASLGYPDMWANNGLFSDAMQNLGILGVFVMPWFVILALRLYEASIDEGNEKIAVSVLVGGSMMLIGSCLVPFLIMHGFLIACLTLRFLPASNDNRG